MRKKEERKPQEVQTNTPAVPKKRIFNVEKRAGYTLHEMWTHKMSYGLVAPFFILFITFSLIPLIWSTGLSFTYWNIFEDPKWTGLHNYVYLFVDDSLFLKAFTNTLTYAVIVGPVSYLMSYFFAWFINQVPDKVRPIYVLAFYAPALTSSIAMTVVWAVFFSNDSTGYLNSFLLKLGLIYEPIQWTADVNYIMPVIIIVALWSSLSTSFLSFVAGFRGVDHELYDAAAVDGVTSRFQKLLYVDVPQTMPQLLFSAVITITSSFTVGATLVAHPSPEDAALTIMLHLGDYSGTRFEVGYASAIAVVLSVMILGLGRVAFKVLGEKE